MSDIASYLVIVTGFHIRLEVPLQLDILENVLDRSSVISSTGVSRTQLNIYDGAFSQKQLTAERN